VDAALTWVDDGIFAGGGEHLPESWEDFARQTGIRAVLHLRPGKPAAFRGAPIERFLWMTVADEHEAGLPERLLAGAFIEGCLRDGSKVLLHSSLGRHRTRWAYVSYRILSGAEAQAAVRRAARPPWLSPYSTDMAAWEALAAVRRSRRRDRLDSRREARSA
jgi:hypothetical protein